MGMSKVPQNNMWHLTMRKFSDGELSEDIFWNLYISIGRVVVSDISVCRKVSMNKKYVEHNVKISKKSHSHFTRIISI